MGLTYYYCESKNESERERKRGRQPMHILSLLFLYGRRGVSGREGEPILYQQLELLIKINKIDLLCF